MRLKIPYFEQGKNTTCGPACVRMVIAHYGIEQSEIELEEACETSWLGNTCEEIASGAQKLSFETEVIENMDLKSIEGSLKCGIPMIVLLDPAILYGGIQGFGHFVVITGLENNAVYYHDPDMGKDLVKDIQTFFNAWARYSFKGVKIWKPMKR